MSKQLIKDEIRENVEDVRREGADVSVPSNSISKELADKIREKYFPKKNITQEPLVKQKYPRHPITMENTPEETITRMRAFPERVAKLRELMCAPGDNENSENNIIPLASENSPEETMRRMRAFPERKAKFLELIRALRKADTR